MCGGEIESFLVVFSSGCVITLVPHEDTQGQGCGNLYVFEQDLSVLSFLESWVQLGCRHME